MIKVYLLILWFIYGSTLECVDFSDLYIMEFYTNGTFNSPEQLRERIRNTLEMSEFQICDNLPVTIIESSPPSIPGAPDTCDNIVYCEKEVDSFNAQKLNIISSSPYAIPCSTWFNKKCNSAFAFMESHNCIDYEKCSTCCILPEAIFIIETFILGTIIPIFFGILFFVLLYILLNKDQIVWLKKSYRLFPRDFFQKMSLSLNLDFSKRDNIVSNITAKTSGTENIVFYSAALPEKNERSFEDNRIILKNRRIPLPKSRSEMKR